MTMTITMAMMTRTMTKAVMTMTNMTTMLALFLSYTDSTVAVGRASASRDLIPLRGIATAASRRRPTKRGRESTPLPRPTERGPTPRARWWRTHRGSQVPLDHHEPVGGGARLATHRCSWVISVSCDAVVAVDTVESMAVFVVARKPPVVAIDHVRGLLLPSGLRSRHLVLG